jgi:sugar (pentulose or hexulose) kinase
VLNDIADTGNLVAVEKSVQPAPAAVADYKQLYTIYEQVYWSLQQAFTEIASYQNKQAE